MNEETYYAEISRLWPKPGQVPSPEIRDVCLAAVREYPESSTFWYDLGIIMQRCEVHRGYSGEDYLRCYKNAIRCDSSNWEAYQELGYVLDVHFDDYDGAERAFRTAIELGGGAESYFGLARVLAQAGRMAEAIHSVSKDVCAYHDDAAIEKLRAEILAGDWSWA
jgi:tetratricopeptide (TPR) repeat protein